MGRDAKLDRIAELLPRASRSERVRIARAVELIDLPAGTISGVVAPVGRWRALVLKGRVQTSNPAAWHAAGSVFEHGPETALIADTDVQLLVADTRSDALEQISAGSTPWVVDQRPRGHTPFVTSTTQRPELASLYQSWCRLRSHAACE